MLHILWMLLKVIGIILLIILGLLILSVCVVLFVPFRYQGMANVSGNIDSLKVEAKFSWLFHLIYGYVIYEDKKPNWQVRILWRRLNKDKQEAMEEPVEVHSKEEESVKSHRESEEPDQSHHESDESKKSDKANKKQGFFEKIKYTIKNICDKIKMLMRQKEQLQKFLVDKMHKSAWKRLIQELVKLLKHIRPKVLKLNLHFGFEDPAMTGKVLAVLSMLYPFYMEHVDIKPDFENQILEGDAFIKGNVRNLHLLIVFWNLFFDKNVKATYKAIQNWER